MTTEASKASAKSVTMIVYWAESVKGPDTKQMSTECIYTR